MGGPQLVPRQVLPMNAVSAKEAPSPASLPDATKVYGFRSCLQTDSSGDSSYPTRACARTAQSSLQYANNVIRRSLVPAAASRSPLGNTD
ncbi:transcription factor HES-1 [Lates japonicus]|uniref:Transcription factor HES-1 n=1 Tax=Lates japonicus TaxID=270547 RepID=A0AAD3RLC5_LATJO|nr:transcription factor HES-1 [Lates japonicus]